MTTTRPATSISAVALVLFIVAAALGLGVVASDRVDSGSLAAITRGNALKAAGELHAALAAYGEAVRLSPNDPVAFHNRAVTLRALGRNDEAIADYSRAIDLAPGNFESLNGRGVALQVRGEHSKAIDDFGAAVRASPTFVAALNNRAVSWRALDRDDRAFSDLDSALAISPNYAIALANRGALHRAAGDWALAGRDLDAAVAVDARLASGYFNRGILRFLQSSYRDASRDFQRALDLGQGGHAALWLILAEERSGGTAKTDEIGAGLPAKWPVPVLEYLRGMHTPAQLIAASKSGTGPHSTDRECEARFFIGEHLLASKAPDASAMLREALAICPRDFVEYEVAKIELQRLAAPKSGPARDQPH